MIIIQRERRKCDLLYLSMDDITFCCPVCLDALLGPHTLHCGHNFCRICIKQLTDACPLCKTVNVCGQVAENKLLTELLTPHISNYSHRDNVAKAKVKYDSSPRRASIRDKLVALVDKASTLDNIRDYMVSHSITPDEVQYHLDHSPDIMQVIIGSVVVLLRNGSTYDDCLPILLRYHHILKDDPVAMLRLLTTTQNPADDALYGLLHGHGYAHYCNPSTRPKDIKLDQYEQLLLTVDPLEIPKWKPDDAI